MREDKSKQAEQSSDAGGAERVRDRTMNRAIRLLAAKARSEKELRERLLEKDWTTAEIVSSVIERLKEYRYIDDEKFATDLALSRIRQRPQGRIRLRQTLTQKSLEKNVVDSALTKAFEEIPEDQLIDAAIETRIRSKGEPVTFSEKKKLYDFLLRRGFDYGLIRDKLSQLDKS